MLELKYFRCNNNYFEICLIKYHHYSQVLYVTAEAIVDQIVLDGSITDFRLSKKNITTCLRRIKFWHLTLEVNKFIIFKLNYSRSSGYIYFWRSEICDWSVQNRLVYYRFSFHILSIKAMENILIFLLVDNYVFFF